MNRLVYILFILFSIVFISKMIVPDNLLAEVEELVEQADDCESESEEDTENDETEWNWRLNLQPSITHIATILNIDQSSQKHLGEISAGERVIFSPPPELMI